MSQPSMLPLQTNTTLYGKVFHRFIILSEADASMDGLLGGGGIPPRYTWSTHDGPERLPRSSTSSGQASAVILVAKRSWSLQRQKPEVFVCKVLPCDARRAKYVQSEYEILQGLRHPNIVRFEDFEYRPASFNAFLYLEYCREGDLGCYLCPGRAQLSMTQLLQITQQISSALVYIHYGILITVNTNGTTSDPEAVESKYDLDGSEKQKFVIHRDIKPHNVFVSSIQNDYLHVKLGDFGYARLAEEDESMSYAGTREYIAPECQGTKLSIRARPRSDVYALGVTMRKLISYQMRDEAMPSILERCCSDDQETRLTSLQLLEEISFALADPALYLESYLHRSILKDGDSPMADTEVISRLLDSGADPAPTGFLSRTPLHLVAQQGHYSASGVKELIQLFINRGADPNVKDIQGQTPLVYAVQAGYNAAVTVLLENGADTFANDNDGRTPINWAELELMAAPDWEKKKLRIDTIDIMMANDLATLDMSSMQRPSKLRDYLDVMAYISTLSHQHGQLLENENLKELVIKMGNLIFRDAHPAALNTDFSNLASWLNDQQSSVAVSPDMPNANFPYLAERSPSTTRTFWNIVFDYQNSETTGSSTMVETPSSNAVSVDYLDDQDMLMGGFHDLEEIPEDQQLTQGANDRILGRTSRPGGRAVGTHLSPKVVKAAHVMRHIVACWHCVLQRDKCDPGDVCQRCVKRAQRPNANVGLGCSRIKLTEFTSLFLHPRSTSFYSNSHLTNTVTFHIRQWGNVEHNLFLSCGKDLPRFPCKAYEFIPKSDELLRGFRQYKVYSGTGHLLFEGVTKSPPLGIVHVNPKEEEKYSKYVNDIVYNHLDQFGNCFWEGDSDNFERKLFNLMLRINPSSDGDAMLLKELIRLIVITYIMGCSLHIPDECKLFTLSRLYSYTGELDIKEVCSPRMVNYQIKYFFSRLYLQSMQNMLLQLQQVFKSSKGCDKWIIAFCALVGLAISLEHQQRTIYLMTATATDPPNEQTEYDSGCREMDTKFDFLVQLFRLKYNRRFNPFTEPTDAAIPELQDADAVKFVRNVATLVRDNRDFLTERSKATLSPMRDPSTRLVARFLLSFWLPE